MDYANHTDDRECFVHLALSHVRTLAPGRIRAVFDEARELLDRPVSEGLARDILQVQQIYFDAAVGVARRLEDVRRSAPASLTSNAALSVALDHFHELPLADRAEMLRNLSHLVPTESRQFDVESTVEAALAAERVLDGLLAGIRSGAYWITNSEAGALLDLEDKVGRDDQRLSDATERVACSMVEPIDFDTFVATEPSAPPSPPAPTNPPAERSRRSPRPAVAAR
jgi:hypothetical protein